MTVNEKAWPRAMVLIANPPLLAGSDPADAMAIRAAAQMRRVSLDDWTGSDYAAQLVPALRERHTRDGRDRRQLSRAPHGG